VSGLDKFRVVGLILILAACTVAITGTGLVHLPLAEVVMDTTSPEILSVSFNDKALTSSEASAPLVAPSTVGKFSVTTWDTESGISSVTLKVTSGSYIFGPSSVTWSDSNQCFELPYTFPATVGTYAVTVKSTNKAMVDTIKTLYLKVAVLTLDGYFTVNGIRGDPTSIFYVSNPNLVFGFTVTSGAASQVYMVVKDSSGATLKQVNMALGSSGYAGSYSLPSDGRYTIEGHAVPSTGNPILLNLTIQTGSTPLPSPSMSLVVTVIVSVLLAAVGAYLLFKHKW